jgi:hypothetical protein
VASASQIFVLPTAVLGVGQHGPFVSPQVGAAFTGYEFHVVPTVGWPTTGDQVMELLVEVSHDGGQTWQFDCSTDFGPLSGWANPSLGVLRVSLGSDSQGNLLSTSLIDLYRFTLNVLQPCGAPLLAMVGTN